MREKLGFKVTHNIDLNLVNIKYARPKKRIIRLGEELEKKQSLLPVFLSTLMFLVSAYLLLAPLAPQLIYEVNDRYKKQVVTDQVDPLVLGSSNIPSDWENYIVIPKISVSAKIVQGDDEKLLDEGMWLRPNGSTPDLGKNSVITGHRFQYIGGSSTFYHLDKLNVGDTIYVYWNGKAYIYNVDETFVVTPDKVEVEDPTSEAVLTLYTCTPVWTATHRLVVRANLEDVISPS